MMAKRLFHRIIISSTELSLKSKSNVLRSVNSKNLHTSEVPVKEIKIPVQWGHLSAKLWGSEQNRPILALHGWQDNAGTWDPLAPMLVKNKDLSILALDFPGHGLSSWIPPGMLYYAWEYPRILLYVKEYFKWDKVSLLSHSMGSIAGFRYACLFPDDIDFYIGIDNLIYEDFNLDSVVDKYPKLLQKILTAQSRLEQEPPCYTKEEIAKIWHLGTRQSVAMESVHYLLERGTKQSTQDPNKYYFSRDSRLKYTLFNPEDKKFVEALALRLKSPTLYIKAIDSPYANDGFAVEMRELIEKNNNKFESQYLPGTHHLHLNNPQILVPPILNFFKKHNLF